MIVRVRNNLGTMKLKIDDDAGAMESTIRDAVMQECRQRQQRNTNSRTKYKLTKVLSFDPSCTHAIDPNQTLRSQGIQHGSMVYCRLEEVEAATEEEGEEENRRHSLVRDANISKNSGGKAKVTAMKEIDVIDLVDSQFASAPSTEEETSDAVVAFNINADAVFNEDNNIPFVHATTRVNNSSSATTNTAQTPIVYSTGQPPQPPPQQPTPQPRSSYIAVATGAPIPTPTPTPTSTAQCIFTTRTISTTPTTTTRDIYRRNRDSSRRRETNDSCCTPCQCGVTITCIVLLIIIIRIYGY
ncbi:hypothetical protein FRACYDRAFT_247253 [Fragilariopsis cylindrus CCMP1102]|uniref:Ubiquitin-like domain-containing protein n=1 Tax=Fragilariopsis cylindrus CCMP1102 TaxID=635003 RepID=A0A1E7EWX1_9STRA|nr:hypothetical protein FRACYDRAFT_247253 [Fragilariopsis cylindrus CCMP1102]|eukprot:OEU10305.1 hypothetical protein FRACYDRAFT_247253 [Fragilariopsis cylindrus CCMP1102]